MWGTVDGCQPLIVAYVGRTERPDFTSRPWLCGGPLDGVPSVTSFVALRHIYAVGVSSPANIHGRVHVTVGGKILPLGRVHAVFKLASFVVGCAHEDDRKFALGGGSIN